MSPSEDPRGFSSPLLALPNTYRAFYGAFPSLRPIQLRTIAPILEGRDLLCQSATGSGKTEAVLAPVLERGIRSGRDRAAVYVVPTRALALDLERRLTPVFERLGLRLAIRTGDLKRAGGGTPDMLLTTPESLDVALGSANADLRRFLERVRTAVVDEIHPLLHDYRGRQLACLLERLERRTGPLQRIGLSATIADPAAVLAFFGFPPDAVHIVESIQREIVPSLVHLQDEPELIALLEDLHEHYGHRKVLLFANSRGRCDSLYGWLNQQGPFQGCTELHYSNLRPRERRAVESRFRRRAQALCIATSTLELGIDIGDVDAVLLYEPPESVSGFLQRLGRANRREPSTRFWGVCRGGRAGEQLVRFLALLELARAGIVEAPPARRLPSVLVQQTLSCLYERKRISLAALQEMFPASSAELGRIVPRMLRNGWLREARPAPLLRGGWRYRVALLERQLWNNLPDTGEPYALEVGQDTIADLPPGLVRQLEAGARVLLAGRKLRVLEIEGKERRVVAEPVTDPEVRDLVWFGSGGRVSYEVAQAMSSVLHKPVETGPGPELGLFRRTRRLLDEERERARCTVTLANGIRACRTHAGHYRYCTFLGSAANLILRWAVTELYPEDDLHAASDEIALDCSREVDFRRLELPRDRSALSAWVSRHLGPLRSALPMNAYAAALPQDLLAEEVADFLYDPRVLEAFARYRKESGAIVAGDPSWMECAPVPVPRVESWPAAGEPLLEWEQRRWNFAEAPPAAAASRARPRRLTATAAGEFIRHEQCERWLSRALLGAEERRTPETELDARRTAHGRQHEEQVLASLQDRGARLWRIAEQGPLEERFAETLNRLGEALGEPEEVWLAHPVLLVPGEPQMVGIPDLLRVHGGSLEVIDVKDTATVRYAQQWQVAFYAALLGKIGLRGATVSGAGSLWLRTGLQSFELRPFLTAFPALEGEIRRILARRPAEAAWEIGTHCTSCPHFSACYREHLSRPAPRPEHHVVLRKRVTRLYPADLATAVFVHTEADPVTGQLLAAGFAASGAAAGRQGWRIEDGEVKLEALFRQLEALRQDSSHFFTFGNLVGWELPAPAADLRQVLQAHFELPVPGRLTLWAAGRVLGIEPALHEPESLWHPAPPAGLEAVLAVGAGLWQWIASRLKSELDRSSWAALERQDRSAAEPYLHFLEEERRVRREDVAALQELSLEERVARFRSVGPMRLAETLLDEEGRFLHVFAAPPGLSKFREDDFLRLLPAGVRDFEDGLPVVLAAHDPQTGRVVVRSRQGRLALGSHQHTSLEEDPTDANLPKLTHVVRHVFGEGHRAARLLEGEAPPPRPAGDLDWIRRWRARMGAKLGLNAVQEQALELPFRHDLALVEGPPGTGKTQLLAWTVIALVEHARDSGHELRLAVTALTHRAIDELLGRVAQLVERHRVEPFPCLKWGRQAAAEEPGVQKLVNAEELLQARHAVLGATGFGLYDLLGAKKGVFPRVFDRVVFDEASQLLVPQALLGLVCGKGSFLFAGDERQLPPVVLGDYQDPEVERSVLGRLLSRTGPEHRVRLELSYRMNEEICAFPSRTWYGGTLRPAPGNAAARLEIGAPRRGDLLDRVLDPRRPCVLLLVEDRVEGLGAEVELMAEMARRLVAEQGLDAGRLALISPHRARNNAILGRLAGLLGPGVPLPLADTVERVQGSERDVVLAALVGGGAGQSEFLNDPRRFNVAITRARTKLVVVGGRSLFCRLAGSAEMLARNESFKAFLGHCRETGSVFEADAGSVFEAGAGSVFEAGAGSVQPLGDPA